MMEPPRYVETMKPAPSPHEKFYMKDMKEFSSNYPKNNQGAAIQESTACNDSKPVSKSGVLWKLFRKPCPIISCCYITWAALPITAIIIGSVYFDKCTIRVKNLIPIFLIIFGCVGLLQTTFGIIKMCLCGRNIDLGDDEPFKEEIKAGCKCEMMITSILFLWIIVGNYLTFGAYRKWVNGGKQSCSAGGDPKLCCDAVPMYFTFVFLILIYCLVVIAFLLKLLFFLLYLVFGPVTKA